MSDAETRLAAGGHLPRIETQFVRFVAVGIGHNALGYLAYLALTASGLPPTAAVSVLYPLGILASFLLNKRWSFGHAGRRAPALGRFVTLYVAGYVFNVAALWYLVERQGLPHPAVQGFLVVFLALCFFVAQRWWVFR